MKQEHNDVLDAMMKMIRTKTPDSFKTLQHIQSEDELFKNPVFNRFMEEAPAIMCIYNYSALQYEYCSPNTKKILGYDASNFFHAEGNASAMAIIEPAHFKILGEKIMPVVMAYYNEYSGLKKVRDLKFSNILKMRKSNGSYIWVLMQLTVMDTDDSGFPLRGLTYISDISGLKEDKNVDFTISLNTKESGFTVLYSVHYNGDEEMLLSKRELEIITLITKGKKSSEIAALLNISPNTVNAHRKNILRKTGKENFMQILNI